MSGEIDSLFNIQWSKGNLGSINFIVQWLSWASVVLISIVGFGIVIFSIGKNALAGLYAVSPKLWDRVDEVKKANISAKQGSGNQLINILGSIPTILCKALPNVKAMTEFDDEQISPKVYFMKSLPILCLQIFVGVFIFFGYPSQVANTVSKFGTGVLDVVFANVDPTAWISKLPGEISVVNYVTKGSKVPFDTNVLKVSQAFQASLASNVSGITADSLESCSLQFEQLALQEMAKMTEAMDTDRYKLAVDATFYREGSDYSGYVAQNNGKVADNVTTRIFTCSVPQDSSVGGLAHGVPGYGTVTFVMTLRFTEQSVDTGVGATKYVSDAILHLPTSAIETAKQNGGWSPIAGIAQLTWSATQSNVSYGSSTIEMKKDGNQIWVKTTAGPASDTILSLGSTSYFTYTAGDGSYTKVGQIVFDVSAGSTAYFTSVADSSVKWNVGEGVPTVGGTAQSDTAAESTENNDNGGSGTNAIGD